MYRLLRAVITGTGTPTLRAGARAWGHESSRGAPRSARPLPLGLGWGLAGGLGLGLGLALGAKLAGGLRGAVPAPPPDPEASPQAEPLPSPPPEPALAPGSAPSPLPPHGRRSFARAIDSSRDLLHRIKVRPWAGAAAPGDGSLSSARRTPPRPSGEDFPFPRSRAFGAPFLGVAQVWAEVTARQWDRPFPWAEWDGTPPRPSARVGSGRGFGGGASRRGRGLGGRG